MRYTDIIPFIRYYALSDKVLRGCAYFILSFDDHYAIFPHNTTKPPLYRRSHASPAPSEEANLRARTYELAQANVIIDRQIDIPYRLGQSWIDPDSPTGYTYQSYQRQLNPVGTVDDVADHIDHVVNLVGVDHVELGSDLDGVFALSET